MECATAVDVPSFLFPSHASAPDQPSHTLSHAVLGRLIDETWERLGARVGDRLFGTSLPGTPQSIVECLLALCCGGEWIAARPGDLADRARLSALIASTAPRFLFADARTWSELASLDDLDARVPTGICVDGCFSAATFAEMRRVADDVWLACAANRSLPMLTLGLAPAADSAMGYSARPLHWAGPRVLDARLQLASSGSAGQLCLAGAVPYRAAAESAVDAACADPISGVALVATGLRARWMFDGRLDFMGEVRAPDPGLKRAVAPTPNDLATTATTLSESERWMAGLWKDLLDVGEVTAADNFFDLGGHSLLAMTFVARVEEYTGVRLGILKVANSSLRALAADVPAQAIAEGPKQTQTLRERALRLFGFKREPGT
jgi:hypothetical protein